MKTCGMIYYFSATYVDILSWGVKNRKNARSKLNCYFSVKRMYSNLLKDELARDHVKGLLENQQTKREVLASEKDFFVSVLNSSVTKRDAKSYIQRFATLTYPNIPPYLVKKNDHGKLALNLAEIYGPAVVQKSPKFLLKPGNLENHKKEPHIHLALIKIRALQRLNDKIIEGIGLTLFQLCKLGLRSIVVLDFNDETGPKPDIIRHDASIKKSELEQANRLISAIENCGEFTARLVDGVIGIDEENSQHVGNHNTRTYIAHPKYLASQLKLGYIPVLLPSGYSNSTQISFAVPANEIVLALVREFFGTKSNSWPDNDYKITVEDRHNGLKDDYLLDRLILLDPLGGIPNPNSSNGYHIFLNMEQEYEDVKRDLSKYLDTSNGRDILDPISRAPMTQETDKNKIFLTDIENKPKNTILCSEPEGGKKGFDSNFEALYHLENLTLTRKILTMLPPSSSALLVSPEEVANTIRPTPYQPDRVGTRPQLNPLIHNLLTNKPVLSCSLPFGRRRKNYPCDSSSTPDSKTNSMTFSRHGMPVTIFPDPKDSPWSPPMCEKPLISLTGPEINLSSLINLINDSFGRTLDVPTYLNRVKNRIAGVIIAGEYEGGAILTWETPPGVDPLDPTRMVPYLDKFAVLRRSQGTGCVADLIFNCMTRKCFPNGVVWRSRKQNPVNKWYFERSQGTWKLSGTDWTMFWSTNLTKSHPQLLFDYEAVCRGIQPTWHDGKDQLD